MVLRGVQWLLFMLMSLHSLSAMDAVGSSSDASTSWLGLATGVADAAAHALCHHCQEPAHPRFSDALACGMGRAPMAKYDSRCPMCRQPIQKLVDNIASANGMWFHKRCAVHVLHPVFFHAHELIFRGNAFTTDATFRTVMSTFFQSSGHAVLSCSPGAGKTTVASMIARAVGVRQVINLMFNKHNMLDAVAKGIPFSYTYHSLACSSILRYLRTEVNAYTNLGEDTFTLTDDNEVCEAIMWTLFPPAPEQCKRNLRGDESRTSVASSKYVLFTDVVTTAINLGMHNCLGINVRAHGTPRASALAQCTALALTT